MFSGYDYTYKSRTENCHKLQPKNIRGDVILSSDEQNKLSDPENKNIILNEDSYIKEK